eukprot:snap_masked-scaffold122_size333723-processed-gene-1.7 protein:Tk04116 transcript:snap_masked-scaffold122_size333723-processed-gene-1.7-mRNA-1 annotation:"hypothetical protein LOTGIDRAFT_226662"
MAKSEECVQVIVRCRPMNAKETEQGHEQCVRLQTREGVVEVKNPKNGPTDPAKSFTFDAVYDCNSRQGDIYEESFTALVGSVLDGFNGTIFAYGQTGTGKTFTMEGIRLDLELRGVIPRSFEHIFTHISQSSPEEQYLVRASYLEIYQEEIRDLLAKNQSQRLELKERPDTGVYVKDLSSFVCKGQSEIEHVMSVGNQNRKVGPTNMNEHSSRSHAIFIITVECAVPDEDTGKPHIRAGKLNLVDLAGSERQAKTGATGERLKEATKINLSLSALGNVISALVDGKSTHIPYRDAKLTRLLQDSLGGNAKTVMVANIGPADYNYEESLTTLRYANRAKNIKNKPRINEDPKDALLREFQDEIARLKAKLGHKGERAVSGGKKRRKPRERRNPDEPMDMSSTSLSDESLVSSPEPPPVVDEGLQQKLADERDLLESDTSLLTSEKERLLNELKAKDEALNRERREQEMMKAKIKAMESKLLSGTGGGNMVEHTNEQKKVLEKRKADIAERLRAEREAARLLEEQEEQGLELEKTYSSLQQEVDSKTKKLKKLFTKLQSTKQDILDVTDEYNRDRRDLEDTQQELLKELKLKYLMIENFIPPSDKNKILSRAQFDEDEDVWYLASPGQTAANTIAKRPVSAVGSRRPMSEYAKVLSSSMNTMNGSRFRGENIMRLGLDRSGRTTRDYEGPAVAPRVQAALDAAMQNIEPDIDIDVMALNSSNHVTGQRNGERRPKGGGGGGSGGRSKEAKENRPSYPASRGLVPK